MTPSGTVFLGAGATLSVPFTVGTHTAQLIVVDNQGQHRGGERHGFDNDQRDIPR